MRCKAPQKRLGKLSLIRNGSTAYLVDDDDDDDEQEEEEESW
jgi:hypothetical protein